MAAVKAAAWKPAGTGVLSPNRHACSSYTCPTAPDCCCCCCLQDLSVIDGDWQRLPEELLRLPLTRLHLRYADFADAEGEPWRCMQYVWCSCGGLLMAFVCAGV